MATAAHIDDIPHLERRVLAGSAAQGREQAHGPLWAAAHGFARHAIAGRSDPGTKRLPGKHR
jgi:hypothetical protein